MSALLAMVALLGLLAILVWQVQRHHVRGWQPESGTVVELAGRAA